MVARRRGKRKCATKGYVFEVSDDDVSSDNSDNECNQPEKKSLKTDSKFVESVVNAISNLEEEAKKEAKASNELEIVEILDETSEECQKSNTSVFIIEDTSLLLEESSCVNNSENPEYLQHTQKEESILILDNSSVENVDFANTSSQDTEVLGCITPDLKFGDPVDIDIEEGELTNETDKVDGPDSIVQISFSNKDISDLYKLKLLNFLTSCTDLYIFKQDDLSITLKKDPIKNSQGWVILDEIGLNDTVAVNNSHSKDDLQSSQQKKKKKKKKKDKELFILDTNPSQSENYLTKYSSKFQIDINDNNEVKETVRISSQTCFNCDQSHALKDCPLPRDYTKINKKRLEFKMKKDKQPSRYHLEEDQKFAHLIPGTMSDKLREALGLKQNELPPFIYQMRQLGYPPGWLEEAKLVYSNLALFDTAGKNVRADNAKKNVGLDSNKIVEYPGFNVPMDKHCKDEYRHYRVPPYSNSYSKTEMIKYFEKEYSKQQDDFETLDMDVDVAIEDVPDREHQHIVVRHGKHMEKDVPSPSLIDLEAEKRNLLAALDSGSNSNPKSALLMTDREPRSPDIDDRLSSPISSRRIAFDSGCDDSQEAAAISGVTCTSSVLNSDFGTPILKSCCPYTRLPDPDNFTKDVSPVINFENLPNATGKYEKMTGLLQRVRKSVKSFRKFDS